MRGLATYSLAPDENQVQGRHDRVAGAASTGCGAGPGGGADATTGAAVGGGATGWPVRAARAVSRHSAISGDPQACLEHWPASKVRFCPAMLPPRLSFPPQPSSGSIRRTIDQRIHGLLGMSAKARRSAERMQRRAGLRYSPAAPLHLNRSKSLHSEPQGPCCVPLGQRASPSRPIGKSARGAASSGCVGHRRAGTKPAATC